MRKITQRAAAFSAAIAGIALIGSGCQASKDKGSEALSSANSAGSAASSAVSSAIGQPGTSGESGSPTESGAASSTEMTGPDGKTYTVSGPVLAKYESLDEAKKADLGKPTTNAQTNPDGGIYQQFDGGVIVHTTRSYVVWGKIRDKWNELDGSQGKLGYPTSDETNTPDGGKQQTFEHGTITWKQGEEEATVEEQ
jgi:uncharacterized protein with LGFP repeats